MNKMVLFLLLALGSANAQAGKVTPLITKDVCGFRSPCG